MQPTIPPLGVIEGHGIGPLQAKVPNQPLRLAVGPECVVSCSLASRSQGVAVFAECAGGLAWADLAHSSAAFIAFYIRVMVALAVDPGDATAENADQSLLLLFRQHLGVRKLGGINGNSDLFEAPAVGALPLAIAGDPVAHLSEAGLRLDVHADQVARPLPPIPLLRWFGSRFRNRPRASWLWAWATMDQVPPQQPGEVPVVEPLVPEIHDLLHLLLQSVSEAAPPER